MSAKDDSWAPAHGPVRPLVQLMAVLPPERLASWPWVTAHHQVASILSALSTISAACVQKHPRLILSLPSQLLHACASLLARLPVLQQSLLSSG